MSYKIILTLSCLLILQSCGTVLRLDKNNSSFNLSNKSGQFCINERKILWKQQSFGTEHVEYEAASISRNEEIKLIYSEISRLNNSFACGNKLLAEIEIVNNPVSEKRLLLLLTIFSLGIIPYWDEYENTLKISTYNDTNLVSVYTSSFKYKRIESIFLLPVTPFYISSEIELNLKTIPLHFQNILNEIRKKDGMN